MLVRRGLALAAVAALPFSLLSLVDTTASAVPPDETSFHRLATYPVFQNVPDGVDPADPTVAEISSVSADGRTLAYTDALGGRIGFLDIADPSAPKGLGSHDVSGSSKGGQPTSVAVTDSSAGEVALVVVDESTYPGLEDTPWEDEDPAPGVREGRLDVVGLAAPHDAIASIDLGGQPDSIAISPDGRYAAIAMENQRNEAVTPEGGDEGDLPQLPSGFVQIIDLSNPDATTWEPRRVDLPAEALAGLDTPEDAEPEYVDINDDNKLALTLQENNGVVVIDLATATIDHAFSAGNARVEGVDTSKNGLFDPTGSIDAPREPDAIQWVGDGLVATANEGDWLGGTRGWTVFDTATGNVVWDAGNTFEQIATRLGLHNNDRAAKKGAEPEGLAFETIGGTPYAFVGSERSNFVAVYDMTDPTAPVYTQALATTNGPEGLLPIPSRDLLVVSSEEDDAEAGVRASVGIFKLEDGAPAFPSVVSGDVDGQPIGWGALGALSEDPADADKLWAASDSAYATGRIYHLDVSASPARIESVLEVTDADGARAKVDIEGISARRGGGFWVASEGATGPQNKVLRLDRTGRVVQTLALPATVADGLGKWGLEGVSAVRNGVNEYVYVALQRAVAGESFARIGRYDVRAGRWTWFGYTLEKTDVEGDWVGLSEITAIDADTVAVIERDKLNGPRAALKAVYTVDLPMSHKVAVRPVRKRLAVDVLPAMQALNGWTQEKLEGLGITGDGRVFAVTDNDGLKDATGETQLLELGSAKSLFRR
ncbi:esterase-like activity of phytase family protein [Nocardioides sp. Root140]|uniref:esterase-like activity of phytase family protein n=1 Tax=Nocardioides sp. Root140 TaxID=1736460 RepID=UPI0006FC4265|nr:esterase-like activity of phytase family protein [Nocardioides sp. Root140]KQY55610.1 alkaline phosphatase [Nocardioides sp. Root140]